MVKAVILDVDGVIVGKKQGFNFPNPNIEVIKLFKKVKAQGIPIILCTGKFNFAIKDIIYNAHLDNPHITDAGSLIIDPLNKKIIKEHLIEKSLVFNLVQKALENNIYLELYTSNDYFIQKGQDENITKKRTPILQKYPVIKDSLTKIIDHEKIIKIIYFTKNDKEKVKASQLLNSFKNKAHIVWSMHPAITPIEPCLITAPNVSKKHAVIETAESLNIHFENILGIGDTLGDWHFMEMCKYVSVPKNSEEELKSLVLKKGKEFSFIGPSVDENGIIEIFKHFNIV
ncbi:MAG: HAD family hydrolase [Candidatus Levybacteria bacterium]|nr:HAD family hydrolase [Candidatus Levybacteria bacterium]